jgi:hypothetical protein
LTLGKRESKEGSDGKEADGFPLDRVGRDQSGVGSDSCLRSQYGKATQATGLPHNDSSQALEATWRAKPQELLKIQVNYHVDRGVMIAMPPSITPAIRDMILRRFRNAEIR